jgi:hypothetical protein
VLDHSDPKLQERYVDPTICPREESGVDVMPSLDLADRPLDSIGQGPESAA